MKNKVFEKFLKINRFIFPYLIGISFLLLGVESYKYNGFLSKHIFLGSNFFLILSVFSIVLLFYSRIINKDYKSAILERFVLDLNAVFFIPVVIFYFVMTFINSAKYSNYSFVTFHIQPQMFLNIVILSFSLFILRLSEFTKIKKELGLQLTNGKIFGSEKDPKVKILLILLFIVLAIYSVNNFANTFANATENFIFIPTHLNYTYDDKMRKTWGFYYDYMKFVEDHTPINSTILIPPQSDHWLTSGNEWVDRYFLYPRNLVQGDVFDIPQGEYDYILISKGEWQSNNVDWGWPKVTVKAEEIWYIDPTTLKVTEVKKDFDPKDTFNMQAWGLIKVRNGVEK